jgi:hypothetical protein
VWSCFAVNDDDRWDDMCIGLINEKGMKCMNRSAEDDVIDGDEE